MAAADETPGPRRAAPCLHPVLLSVFTPAPIHLIAILVAGLVALSVVSGHRNPVVVRR